MRVAIDVQARKFISLFLERIENLSLSI